MAGEEGDTIDPHENSDTGDYNDIDYDDLEISESRTLRPIRGQYPGHSGPIRGQDPGHVITLDQSEARNKLSKVTIRENFVNKGGES